MKEREVRRYLEYLGVEPSHPPEKTVGHLRARRRQQRRTGSELRGKRESVAPLPNMHLGASCDHPGMEAQEEV